MKPAHKQKGVALITVMLIVTLVVIIAATLATRQELDIRRTGNVLSQEQGWLYVLGIEDWAKGVLKQDQKDTKYDHLNESWTLPLQPIEVDGGYVSGLITDEQGKFNINNLVKDGKPSQPDVEMFKRLLTALEVDAGIAQAVVDWLDTDQETQFPNGAEDQYYQSLDTPYRTANRSMIDISELRLIKGIDADTYAKLIPAVTVIQEHTAININTAPEAVIASLSEKIGTANAAALVDARGENGFETVESFLQHQLLAGSGLEGSGITVKSSYFRLESDAEIAGIPLKTSALLARKDNNKVYVLVRKRRSY